MPLFNGPLRDVIWNPRFEAELSAIQPDTKEQDEILQAIEHIVARTPEHGTQAEGSHVWVKEADYLTKGIRLFVFYAFNDTKVIVLSVQVVKGATIWPT